MSDLADDTFAAALLEEVLTLIGELITFDHQGVEQSGELMGCSGHRARGKPLCEHILRKCAPSADWLERSAAAGSRRACATRLAHRWVLPLSNLTVGKRDMSYLSLR